MQLSDIYLSPQCHPARDGQRGKCWCVDQKTGLRLPGPLEQRGDLDCHQLMTATLRDWGVGSGSEGRRTSWTLLVLIGRNYKRKGLCSKASFQLRPIWAFTTKRKPLNWVLLLFCVCVCESMWNLWSTCCVLFILWEVETNGLKTHALLSHRWQKKFLRLQM